MSSSWTVSGSAPGSFSSPNPTPDASSPGSGAPESPRRHGPPRSNRSRLRSSSSPTAAAPASATGGSRCEPGGRPTGTSPKNAPSTRTGNPDTPTSNSAELETSFTAPPNQGTCSPLSSMETLHHLTTGGLEQSHPPHSAPPPRHAHRAPPQSRRMVPATARGPPRARAPPRHRTNLSNRARRHRDTTPFYDTALTAEEGLWTRNGRAGRG